MQEEPAIMIIVFSQTVAEANNPERLTPLGVFQLTAYIGDKTVDYRFQQMAEELDKKFQGSKQYRLFKAVFTYWKTGHPNNNYWNGKVTGDLYEVQD
jgi:hypothetical protein